jgi:hypothetical protein
MHRHALTNFWIKFSLHVEVQVISRKCNMDTACTNANVSNIPDSLFHKERSACGLTFVCI